MAGRSSVGSATSLVKETPAEKSELIMVPASTVTRMRFPFARLLTKRTRSTVAMEKAKAETDTPNAADPAKMAIAAPKAAPCEAPRMSGDTSGF